MIVSHDDRLREIADRVLWLEDGQFRQIASMTVDPVCRMSVEPTGAHLEWHGQTVWFCSEGCKREFAEDPAVPTTAARRRLGQQLNGERDDQQADSDRIRTSQSNTAISTTAFHHRPPARRRAERTHLRT